MQYFIPADVPSQCSRQFRKNYEAITHKTENLFLFAADQKLEHLNQDFFGEGISPEAATPEHLFAIANNSDIGAFATQLGLIARYGKQYPKINYLVKLNSKTNALKSELHDPISEQLWTVYDSVRFKQDSGLNICGVGYTIYLGSEYESVMIQEAAQIINNAHQEGLVTILWIYPRGKSISGYSPELLAGSAGVANALGADFVKLHLPRHADFNDLIPAVKAGGNTKIIVSGGEKVDEDIFLKDLEAQLSKGTYGTAVGRNLFQRPSKNAADFAEKISKIIYKLPA
jgi:fructose-bisphosphate aldolase / 6-deoxy-5-ketofructose 1-phosphate synthase